MSTTYKSKVDLWLPLVIIGCTTLSLLPVMLLDFNWTAVAMIAVILPLVLVHVYAIRYVIEGETLTVKCGFILKERYDIRDIRLIAPSRSILSSPAASLDRISIRFARRKQPLIISPKDKQGFMAHLKAINPDIEIAKHK